MRGAARQFVLALCALLSCGSVRAEIVYYWAFSTVANAGSCAGASPHPTCDVTPEGAMQKRLTNMGAESWKMTSGASCSSSGTSGGTFSTGPTGIPSGSYSVYQTWTTAANCTGSTGGGQTVVRSSTGCDTTVPGSACYVSASCSVPAGTKKFVEFPIGSYFPDGTCASSCRWTRDAVGIGLGGKMTYGYSSTGESCSDTENTDVSSAPTTDNDSEFDNCTTTGGNTLCYTDNRTNCGEVNGEYVCLPSAPDGCSTGAGGGKICGPASDTPPAPDDGRPGVPADPDAVIPVEEGAGADGTGGNTTNNYYYNNGTVQGSSNQTGPEGGDPLCDSATDPNCVDSGKEWVDRDYKAPGMPDGVQDAADAFRDGNKDEAFEGWGSDGIYGIGLEGNAGTFVGWLSDTFPFSLAFSGPLQMMSAGTSTPQFSYTASGHTASASMGMWDDLFALVRVVSGVLLIYGVWLLCLSTISVWAGR